MTGCASTTKLSNLQSDVPPSVLLVKPEQPVLLQQGATLKDLMLVHIENARLHERTRNQLEALIDWHQKQQDIIKAQQ